MCHSIDSYLYAVNWVLSTKVVLSTIKKCTENNVIAVSQYYINNVMFLNLAEGKES